MKPLTNDWQSINEYAEQLGGKRDPGGINWTWFSGFPTKASAELFLTHPGVQEHRGVYNDNGTFSTRVR